MKPLTMVIESLMIYDCSDTKSLRGKAKRVMNGVPQVRLFGEPFGLEIRVERLKYSRPWFSAKADK